MLIEPRKWHLENKHRYHSAESRTRRHLNSRSNIFPTIGGTHIRTTCTKGGEWNIREREIKMERSTILIGNWTQQIHRSVISISTASKPLRSTMKGTTIKKSKPKKKQEHYIERPAFLLKYKERIGKPHCRIKQSSVTRQHRARTI